MRTGQFAMEYMLVVGFSLVILVPIIALIHEEFADNRTELGIEHMSSVAREIAFQSEKIYYQGAPSRTTIEAYFPQGVGDVRIENPGGDEYYYIIVEMDPDRVVIEQLSKVPIEIDSAYPVQSYDGIHTIALYVDEGDVADPDDDIVVIGEYG